MRAGPCVVVVGAMVLGVAVSAGAQQGSMSTAVPSASASQALPGDQRASEAGPSEHQPEGGAEMQANARDHFDQALELYRSGDYAGAAEELNAALALDPNSRDLIYNLGLVYEKLGDLDGAVAQFERLLDIEKHPGELERVRRALVRLEGARRYARSRADAQCRVEQPPEQAPPPRLVRVEPSPAQPETYQPLDGWVLGAGALALAAVSAGAALGVAALASHPGSEPRTTSDRSIQEVEDRAELAHSLAVAADIAFAVGVVSGGVALGLHVSRARPAESGPESSSGSGMGLGLGLQGAF